ELIRYALNQQAGMEMKSVQLSKLSDSLGEDWHYYMALLARENLSPTEIENIEHQRRYLDEVHASFLGNHVDYFNLNAQAYNNLREGIHRELVGLMPPTLEWVKNWLDMHKPLFWQTNHFSAAQM
ncbi:MAG: hypothetical protein KGL95_10650, partial [Patescibacteria group bacterium]|nr:hypothetical protein [Patescibacteria group bacterium]